MKQLGLLTMLYIALCFSCVSQNNCRFDQETQTDEFLKGISELENYEWNQETKTATIVLSDFDTLLIERGGCNHFGVSAEFILREDPRRFENWDNVFDKVLWIAKILDNEFAYEAIKVDLCNDSLRIEPMNSAEKVFFSNEYLVLNHYELVRFLEKDVTRIILCYYIE